MADISTLESVAKLLPPGRRERFFAIASKFSNVSEDDDHLQMLEAVGFIMLVMKEIPGEILTVVEKAHAGLDDGQAAILGSQIEEILTQSLDTPSYKDLRDTVRSMREHEERFRRNVDDFGIRIADAEKSLRSRNRLAPAVASGFVGGIVCAVLLGVAAYLLIPKLIEPEPLRIPMKLIPYAELHRQGKLDYLETELPEHGNVAIYMIGGDVIATTKDGSHGAVMIRKKSGKRE